MASTIIVLHCRFVLHLYYICTTFVRQLSYFVLHRTTFVLHLSYNSTKFVYTMLYIVITLLYIVVLCTTIVIHCYICSFKNYNTIQYSYNRITKKLIYHKFINLSMINTTIRFASNFKVEKTTKKTQSC